MEKKKAAIDVAVLILFFNRPNVLKPVFEAVKKARPSRLYLYQDGAREGREDDVKNVLACREIVSDIDWECEVHRNFREKNQGCDPSEYLAQKWMFETEEMGIVLEDDDVPSQSFFPYCKELLEKYKDDQRINMICGMNNLETYDCPYDYVFTTSETITGWASWKRVIDEWTERVEFIYNPYYAKKYKDVYSDRRDTESEIALYKKKNDEGIAFYESILASNCLINNRLNIVPTKNLISNIGNVSESTHGVADPSLLPKGLRRIFNMKTYELDFPLKHQEYVIEDVEFRNKLYRVMGKNHPWVNRVRRVQIFFLYIKAGKASEAFGHLLKRLRK